MKALKIIGIVILVIVVGVAVWMMTWPNEAHLERKAEINAPVEKVFAVVNDFGQTKHWNPWMKIDPNAKYIYSDNLVGAGAWYSWTSENGDVGDGRQELLESVENKTVKTKMEFGGMEGKYTADFVLEPNGENTVVTWTFDGKGEQMSDKFFFSMADAFLGSSYEQGLADLKTYIEGLPDPEPDVVESDSTLIEADTTVVEE